jgi:hypothetical protein
VQQTKGSAFLDPAENARGCLRIVALALLVGAIYLVSRLL